ncbi:MAG: 4Fe-4S double cluster binding domain-containing protein [Candidatus Bathyarchaeia archaeon]
MGIADPGNFKMAFEGCHPRDILKTCNSVIVFAMYVGLDYYTTLEYNQKNGVESRIFHIYRDWISLQLANFLADKGYKAVIPQGFKEPKDKIARLSFKLAAYEAGLGVYGRNGVIITPEYGQRVNFGVVLTDAYIKHDKPLKDFNPCKECDTCARVCPVKAIDKEKLPPTSYDRKRCLSFIDKIIEKTKWKVKLCGYCFNYCPAGKIKRRALKLGQWKTLLDLSENKRRNLTN